MPLIFASSMIGFLQLGFVHPRLHILSRRRIPAKRQLRLREDGTHCNVGQTPTGERACRLHQSQTLTDGLQRASRVQSR